MQLKKCHYELLVDGSFTPWPYLVHFYANKFTALTLGALRCLHVFSTITNHRKNSFELRLNIVKHSFKVGLHLQSIVSNRITDRAYVNLISKYALKMWLKMSVEMPTIRDCSLTFIPDRKISYHEFYRRYQIIKILAGPQNYHMLLDYCTILKKLHFFTLCRAATESRQPREFST